MIKVKQRGHENVKTRLHPNEVDRLILVEEHQLQKMKDEDNLWFEKDDFIMEFDACQKIIVEAYYCGFLDYYDEHVRGGLVEHDIHFDWSVKDGKSYLKVYLWPAPVREKPDSLIRSKVDELKAVESAEPQGSSLAPPPDSATSDPPPPPNPPHAS